MKKIFLKKTLVLLGVASLATTACARPADLNQVAEKMAIMLQNNHYAKLDYNQELSQRFFNSYLADLDFQKLYFTQQDVDFLQEKYGKKLHVMILRKESLTAANEIYDLFRKRVRERVAQANELLKNDFDLTKKDSVMLSREDANWAKDEVTAKKTWAKQIKEAVLAEVLRRELIAQMAKEQGKDDPSADDRSPKQKVALRYKRLLSSVENTDSEDVAAYFLSSVANVYDPHTDYLSAREMNKFRDGMKNELIGIGALLQAEEDGATVIKGIVVGGPADKEGSLKLNDRIVGVNSSNSGNPEDMTDIMFMKIDKVVDLIRGKSGTSVALKVEPAGAPAGTTKIIVIDREAVELKDGKAAGQVILKKTEKGETRKIGVITLPSFYADFENGEISSADDVKRILQRMVEEKIDGLLFDLRNNGGGSLEEVRKMVGFFIQQATVVQIRSYIDRIRLKETDDEPAIYNGPMVVLVNKSSASASEIIAGALQDYNRAVIVGDSTTFGKGTVQQPMDIGRMMPLFAARDQAGYLKLTIQKFYRPSGSSTQLDGVKPDIVLPSVTDALEIGEAYLDNALRHDRIRPTGSFQPLDSQNLYLPLLQEQSKERVAKSKDYQYLIEDIIKAKARIKANVISLNKAERKADLAKADLQKKDRNQERRNRFKKIAEDDAKTMTFYRLNLDDLEKEKLEVFDPNEESADYMRRAKGETEDLDTTPEWPSGLSPEKRESLKILSDLVGLSLAAETAGLTND